MKKWWYRRVLLMILVISMVSGTGLTMTQLTAEAERSRVSGSTSDAGKVIPGGMPIGIYMEMDGILVLDTEEIKGVDGNPYEPAKNLVRSGDYITAMNGENVEDKKELIRAVNELEDAEVILGLRRNGEQIEIKMKSVEVQTGQYKLGIWVKDNIQGLGTVTYVTENGAFGALGHGIHDTDTDKLIEIDEGAVYQTKIVGIQKGVKGEPGGLEGIIAYSKYNCIGEITDNTENGIYGTIDEKETLLENQEAMEVCKKKDIKLGKATIRCTINGKVEEYEIKIKNVDYYTANVNKGIMIEITDEKLIALTGGIVQGMSGSPILQNGKIVGAVTHVLVNDPTKGYGIFIEDML